MLARIHPNPSRALMGGAIASVVVAAVLLAGMAWHASSLEFGDDVRGEVDVVALDGWATPSGFVVVSADERTGARELVTLSVDGDVLARAEVGSDRLAQISMAGDVVFLDDGYTRGALVGAAEISAMRVVGDGIEEVWTRGLTDDDSGEQMVELTVVAHARSGETTLFGCARTAGSCWFVGLDPTGSEQWRMEAGDLRPSQAARRSGEDRPWLVPEELVVVYRPVSLASRENRPVLRVDVTTGETMKVASGARAVVGDGFVVVSNVDDAGCGLVVLREGSQSWSTEVPCGEEDRAPLHELLGRTVTFTSGDQVVVADLDEERTGTFPREAAVNWTGAGTAVAVGDSTRIHTVADELVADFGSGWNSGAVGLDTVVLRRIHRSSNPFAADASTEVKVIDVSDGSVCAHVRLDGESTTTATAPPALALPGCAALVEVDGTTHLLGR